MRVPALAVLLVTLSLKAFSDAVAADQIYVTMLSDAEVTCSNGQGLTADKGDSFPFVGYNGAQTLVQLKWGDSTFWTRKSNVVIVSEADTPAAAKQYADGYAKVLAGEKTAREKGLQVLENVIGLSKQLINVFGTTAQAKQDGDQKSLAKASDEFRRLELLLVQQMKDLGDAEAHMSVGDAKQFHDLDKKIFQGTIQKLMAIIKVSIASQDQQAGQTTELQRQQSRAIQQQEQQHQLDGLRQQQSDEQAQLDQMRHLQDRQSIDQGLGN